MVTLVTHCKVLFFVLTPLITITWIQVHESVAFPLKYLRGCWEGEWERGQGKRWGLWYTNIYTMPPTWTSRTLFPFFSHASSQNHACILSSFHSGCVVDISICNKRFLKRMRGISVTSLDSTIHRGHSEGWVNLSLLEYNYVYSKPMTNRTRSSATRSTNNATEWTIGRVNEMKKDRKTPRRNSILNSFSTQDKFYGLWPFDWFVFSSLG